MYILSFFYSVDIDKLDTETLIRMTKQKHLENMTEADKQIHARLGQLSSKLSWVVEYPPKSGEQGNKTAAVKDSENPQGLVTPQQQLTAKQNRALYEMLANMEDDEDDVGLEDYDEEEDDDEFNEDDLDEEDKAALRKMREDHLKKHGSLDQVKNFQASEGNYMVHGMGAEHFEEEEEEEEYPDEEDMEDFEHYEDIALLPEMSRNDGMQEDMPLPTPQYRRTSSPTMDNFLMMGPVMAKCLICNKIVRKTETKLHLESHTESYEDEENQGEIDEEEMEGEEFNDEGEENEEPEFTAEKLVDETFVAEKIASDSGDSPKKSGKSTVCDICNKNFKSHGNMIRHKLIHTESKDFVCPVCSKSFKLQTYLTKHIKKYHKNFKEPQEGDPTEDTVAEDSNTTEPIEQEHTEANT